MKRKKKRASSQDYRVISLYPEGSFASKKIEMPKRVLIRPKINYLKVIIILVLTIIGAFAIFFSCDKIQGGLIKKNIVKEYNHTLVSAIITSVCLLIHLFILRKRILIWFVHLYQRYASDEVRLRCVFTPSCSEYMILAIKKYGAIKGVCKGIGRLRRCHYPNGGEDYP